MIDTFIKFLTYEKRASPHTITSYQTDLLQFNAFLKHHAPDLLVAKADHREIRAWVVDLANKQNTARSINRKISTLRSFYKFLQQRGHNKQNPTHKVRALKANYPLPHFVQTSDLFSLLDQCEFSKDFHGYRDRLILELFYGAGIRLSELINLETAHVNLHETTIRVHGKGAKERIIPFPKSLAAFIEHYLEKKREFFNSEALNHFLLVTDKGDQLYPMMVYRTVRKYLDEYTTIDKRSPHVIRHTFATHLLDNGADLNAIKDLLGHATLAATQVYTHNSTEQLKKVFKQAHPKA